MRKCKCVVLERISNGNTTFRKGDIVSVQFYKLKESCDVWGLEVETGKMKGVVTSVNKSKVKKLNQ